MDIEKNGESSSSCNDHNNNIVVDGPMLVHGGMNGDVDMESGPSHPAKTRLILPEWDVTPPKHLHASHDLISLLHLDGLFNTFVRPYFEPVPDSDDEGDIGTGGGGGGEGYAGGANEMAKGVGGSVRKRGRRDVKRKQGLSKGYVGLLEDCIDPVPAGSKPDLSLLSLVPDLRHPPSGPAPSSIWPGPLEPLSAEQLSVARLEQGTKVEGYAGGEKIGVREAEEKRNRRKQLRLSQSLAPEPIPSTPGPPIAPPSHLTSRLSQSSAPGSASHGSHSGGSFRRPSAPNTAPIGGSNKHVFSRATAPPTSRAFNVTPGSGSGSGIGRAPNTPTPMPRFPFARQSRSGSGGEGGNGMSVGVATPIKRPLDGSGGLSSTNKKPKGGSGSASPGDVGVKAMFKGARSRTVDS